MSNDGAAVFDIRDARMEPMYDSCSCNATAVYADPSTGVAMKLSSVLDLRLPEGVATAASISKTLQALQRGTPQCPRGYSTSSDSDYRHVLETCGFMFARYLKAESSSLQSSYFAGRGWSGQRLGKRSWFALHAYCMARSHGLMRSLCLA